MDKKRDEFQSTYMSGVKSSSDVAQNSWIQAEQFKLHEDQAFSNEMASMTSTSNSLMGLPPLCTYNAT
jgi:hypothetical protein